MKKCDVSVLCLRVSAAALKSEAGEPANNAVAERQIAEINKVLFIVVCFKSSFSTQQRRCWKLKCYRWRKKIKT